MNKLSRRDALKKSLKSAVAISAPMVLPASVLGIGPKYTAPNSRINMGLIGHGKIMNGHRKYHAGSKEVEVVAICGMFQNVVGIYIYYNDHIIIVIGVGLTRHILHEPKRI